jgi:pimeloyl-ACP methyl ester carboxylesterase
MPNTIIFLNGFAIPPFLAKTGFVWDDSIWKDYNRVYNTSKVPISDNMVERELNRLSELISKYENPIVAGHSLGAWWAANLAAHTQFNIKKLVLLTPLGDTTHYPILNISNKYHLPLKEQSKICYGKEKTLLIYSSMDLIVPHKKHCPSLIKMFNPTVYSLLGGHLFQLNHKAGLSFMKKWIESKYI